MDVGKITLKDAEKKEQLAEAEILFRKGCYQVGILNKRLEDVKERYIRAKDDNFRCFRYNLRLKLAVLEGVRNMYYEYVSLKAENIADLRRDLYGEIIEIVSDESSEESEEELEEEADN